MQPTVPSPASGVNADVRSCGSVRRPFGSRSAGRRTVRPMSTTVPDAIASPDDTRRQVVDTPTPADRIFRRLTTGGGVVTLVLLVVIGAFLVIEAAPALRTAGWDFFTVFEWSPDTLEPAFGIGALLFWTVVIAAIAMVVAIPLSILAALFVTEYAPPRLRRLLVALVDLLAAVPSLVFGLWGVFFLQPRVVGTSRWLSDWLDALPLFRVERPLFTSSAFIAGLVLALMVVPITTSVVREVFSQAPPGEKEAALALGGSRWGMVRTVVLPFGRAGIIGGSMLGLGRALGETIAVAIIISPVFTISPRVLEAGANSIAAHIALRFGEAQELGLSALMAAGLVLFGLTLVVNTLASLVVARSRSGAGVDL